MAERHDWDALMRRCQDGDADAFVPIVKSMRGPVAWAVWSTLGSSANRSDVDELVGDTFLRAWARRDQYRPQGELRAWLCRVARRVTLDFIRRRGRRPEGHLADGDTSWLWASGSGTQRFPERDALLRVWLAKLPEDERLAAALHFVGGLSLRELETALEVSLHEVRTRLARATARLKVVFDGLGGLRKESS